VRFHRALYAGKRADVLRREFPAVFAAHEIHAADDMQRCEIEARLLAGQREDIAEKVGIGRLGRPGTRPGRGGGS
jgi:hypothetical protein